MASQDGFRTEGAIKTTHEHLAGIVKGVHRHLRREVRADGCDHETVWEKHTQDETRLRLYADAMYRLATEHWSVYPETRIEWCRKVALEYFLNGGLEIALQKDAKRLFHERKKAALVIGSADIEGSSYRKRDFTTYGKPDAANDVNPGSSLTHSCQATQINPTPAKEDRSCGSSAVTCDKLGNSPAFPQDKIRLLDVGSCYNPFVHFQEFEAVGVDLCPAIPTVLQCDFLKLTTRPPLHDSSPSSDPLNFDLKTLTSPVSQLPSHSFHVVVFSLLLEYLPAPTQRWRCCVTACNLLTTNGLLLLVTPDSHSQHRNAPMMKSWRRAVEQLGFTRWKYEKKEHIHCMAFRKVVHPSLVPTTVQVEENGDTNAVPVADLMWIPQDFNDACYEGHELPRDHENTRSDDTQEFIMCVAEELPMLGLDGEEDMAEEEDEEQWKFVGS